MGFDFNQMFGLQGKKNDIRESDPYAHVKGLLRQTATQGQKEWQNMWQNQWQNNVMPNIQEQFQAKRRLGAGSTPEVAALGKAGSNLMNQMSTQDLQARMQALGMLARTPTQFSSEPVFTGGQNLMNLLAPIAGQVAGSTDWSKLFNNGGGSNFFENSNYLNSPITPGSSAGMPTGASLGLG